MAHKMNNSLLPVTLGQCSCVLKAFMNKWLSTPWASSPSPPCYIWGKSVSTPHLLLKTKQTKTALSVTFTDALLGESDSQGPSWSKAEKLGSMTSGLSQATAPLNQGEQHLDVESHSFYYVSITNVSYSFFIFTLHLSSLGQTFFYIFWVYFRNWNWEKKKWHCDLHDRNIQSKSRLCSLDSSDKR